jgi:hypothetical protein
MFRVCYETPLPPSVVTRQPSLRPFDAVVLKALARSPEDRFASAAEFLEALVSAQAGGPASADATVMFARRAPEATAPVVTNETLMLARRPPPQGPGPMARADETLILPREATGPSITDETLISPRRSAQTSRLPGADETLLIPRHSVPDDPNLTIIRAIPTETPVTEPLVPLRAVEPELHDEPASQPASQPARRSPFTGALTPAPSTAAGWNPQALTQIERQLAHFLGPIARVLVRTATQETSDLVSLIQWLAAKISIAPDREAFLRGAGVVSTAAVGRSNSDTKSSAPQTGSGAPLTPEYIARASQLLAIYLGPIAQILARRAAQQGPGREQFVATLATHLSDDRERARFLRALG